MNNKQSAEQIGDDTWSIPVTGRQLAAVGVPMDTLGYDADEREQLLDETGLFRVVARITDDSTVEGEDEDGLCWQCNPEYSIEVREVSLADLLKGGEADWDDFATTHILATPVGFKRNQAARQWATWAEMAWGQHVSDETDNEIRAICRNYERCADENWEHSYDEDEDDE